MTHILTKLEEEFILQSVTVPEKPMVTVQRINMIEPIDGADQIELATVQGWRVVISKNDNFKIGNLCAYAVIDTVFPKSFTKMNFLEGKPLKTRKIRGEISQGLIFPLENLSEYKLNISQLVENQDLTEIIGVMKYVSPEEIASYNLIKSDSYSSVEKFPSHLVPKTDEPRLQNITSVLDKIKKDNIFVTRKEDGCSATYIFDGVNFIICSRNFVLNKSEPNSINYIHIAEKFKIEEIMKKYNKKIAIQGEIVGPKINGNRLKLDSLDFRVFSIYDIENQSYVLSSKMFELCKEIGLNTVPLLYHGPVVDPIDSRFESVKSCLEYASSMNYVGNSPIEGIVIRNDSHSISFKVISNRYLLKNNL